MKRRENERKNKIDKSVEPADEIPASATHPVTLPRESLLTNLTFVLPIAQRAVISLRETSGKRLPFPGTMRI